MSEHQQDSADHDELRIRAERTGPALYTARNSRGATVQIGGPGAEGSFTPGELLQAALAACASLSADHALRSLLGDDFEANTVIEAQGVPGDYRYESFVTLVDVDFTALDPERHEALITRAERAIERYCAVGRTIQQGAAAAAAVRPRKKD